MMINMNRNKKRGDGRRKEGEQEEVGSGEEEGGRGKIKNTTAWKVKQE